MTRRGRPPRPRPPHLGAALRHYRRAAKLTGTEAARRAGYSDYWLYAVERGTMGISPFALQVLADVYGVSVAELLEYEPPRAYRRVAPLVAEGDEEPRRRERVVGAPACSAWEEVSDA